MHPRVAARLPEGDNLDTISKFTPVIPGALAPGFVAPTYTIFQSKEGDVYEKDKATGPDALAPAGDNFKGTARKRAKTSIASASLETFVDVKALIDTLPDHVSMVNLLESGAITTKATSDRVVQEKRNVKVTAFLYAASREDDNDFHLIIGRDPNLAPVYMNVEISGLPPAGDASHTQLETARNAYKTFFTSNLPGTKYAFYDPPIACEVEGSLFWDASHENLNNRPGPASLRADIPTVWEIHPITNITF